MSESQSLQRYGNFKAAEGTAQNRGIQAVTSQFGRQVAEFLNQNFKNRWTGRPGPVAWPPRSPDQTP